MSINDDEAGRDRANYWPLSGADCAALRDAAVIAREVAGLSAWFRAAGEMLDGDAGGIVKLPDNTTRTIPGHREKADGTAATPAEQQTARKRQALEMTVEGLLIALPGCGFDPYDLRSLNHLLGALMDLHTNGRAPALFGGAEERRPQRSEYHAFVGTAMAAVWYRRDAGQSVAAAAAATAKATEGRLSAGEIFRIRKRHSAICGKAARLNQSPSTRDREKFKKMAIAMVGKAGITDPIEAAEFLECAVIPFYR
jgi:hypothetical protein